MGGVWDRYGTGMGQVWDGYGTGMGRDGELDNKFTGSGWVAEIKYSVCSHPFMRPREARLVRDCYGTGKGQAREW